MNGNYQMCLTLTHPEILELFLKAFGERKLEDILGMIRADKASK